MKNIVFLSFIILLLASCGKVGPLSLPEDKVDKSVITYPCNEACMKVFEEEKQRQQSVVIQVD